MLFCLSQAVQSYHEKSYYFVLNFLELNIKSFGLWEIDNIDTKVHSRRQEVCPEIGPKDTSEQLRDWDVDFRVLASTSRDFSNY